MVTPIACSQPSAALLNRSGHSGLMNTKNPSEQKKTRVGESPTLALSTFAVLPPPTPGVGFGKGGPRGSLPPELPAGKRGGWHHDSVYPSFRLTSFAPRALNFEPSVPAEGPSPSRLWLDASQIRRRVWRLRGDRIAARIRARGGEAARGSW